MHHRLEEGLWPTSSPSKGSTCPHKFTKRIHKGWFNLCPLRASRACCCCWSCPRMVRLSQHRAGTGQKSQISHNSAICAELKQGCGSTFCCPETSWQCIFCFNFVSSGCLLLSLNHHLTHAIYHDLSHREMMSYASHRGKKSQNQNHKIIYIFQRDQLSCCLVWRSKSSWVIVVNTVVFVIRLIGYLKHKENKKKSFLFFFSCHLFE